MEIHSFTTTLTAAKLFSLEQKEKKWW
jgi:hypothetical protein